MQAEADDLTVQVLVLLSKLLVLLKCKIRGRGGGQSERGKDKFLGHKSALK